MKNKNNVLIFAAVIAFMALYQFFVLAPYQEAHRVAQQQLQKENPTTAAASPAASAKILDSTADTKKPLSAVAEVALEEASAPLTRDVIMELQTGPKRSLEIVEGGALGRAQLTDYFVRGGDVSAPIVLNTDGMEWVSTNPAIQRCLNALNKSSRQTTENPNEIFLKATTPQGTCELHVVPSPKHAGLVAMTLTLDGFVSSVGEVVELRSRGTLGSEVDADQNYMSYKIDDAINNVRGKDLFARTEVRGRMNWLTWGDRYFSVIVKPLGIYNPDFTFGSLPSQAGAPNSEIPVSFAIRYPAQPEAAKSRFDFATEVYFGTRDTSVLNEIAPELVETVDLGFFASVARVMLWSLKALNTFFHNFGVSIIALTLIVRVVFWPLNKKAYTSTIKMKELQPEMDRIRKKYDAGDRSQAEKMNKEIFALYKNKKVNPLGGCLPMLLQLPIFIGLYGALNHSIDLYQAPFFGWIQDLSMRDPFYILPVLWTVSLLGYMQINPQAMNTNQPGMPNMKWIMMGMNVFFGFLSKDWPSGLVLYLVVSNCVGLAQQFFLQRSSQKLQLLKEGA